MPIESEGLDHDRECPECKGALTESIGYELCPHCNHRLTKTSADGYGSTPYRTTQWQCPQCENWNYQYQGSRGGQGWHNCENCDYQERNPSNFNRRQAPEDWNEQDQGVYDYDDGWVPMDRHAKFQVVALGEMQQPGGVGATQTTGLTDGAGLEHPDDHSDMTDAAQNGFEQNVALETWVNFAVDMLNRGKSEQEVTAQLAHDGCPEPASVLQRAMEQPQQDPVGTPGTEDPFETPAPADPTGTMESVHQQPPVLSHWLESPEDKVSPGRQVRIADTSWRGIELARWEDLYGQKMARIALNDGGIITVAAEVVEADGARKIQDPSTEIQNFIDSMPQVEPTRPSILARMANLKMVRMAVRQNISKSSFSDQVKLERIDRNAEYEISGLTDFLGRLASDADQQYVREQQRYRQAGQHNRERVTNEGWNSRIAETAAIFVQELAPETRADAGQTAYAAAHFASQNNGDVPAFVTAVQKAAARSDYDHWNEEADHMWWQEEGRHPEEPPEPDPYDDYDGAADANAEQMYEELEGMDDYQLEEIVRESPGWIQQHPEARELKDQFEWAQQILKDRQSEGDRGMSDNEYWDLRQHGAHPDHNPEEDPFAIWPGGHPMDH